MSAPVTERPRTASKSAAATKSTGTKAATIPAQRGKQRRAQQATPGVARPSAATRAYARRDDRLRKLVGDRVGRVRLSRVTAVPGRTPFVLLVMGLLGVGLVATLWLSTAAAVDSYRLTDARTAARSLQEQSEQLHRQVATMESAPEIARRAEQLGMVSIQDPPRLVVAPDGGVTVVGEPHAVSRPAPVVPPAAAAPVPQTPAEAATQADESVPAAGAPATTPTSTPVTPAAPAATQGQQGTQQQAAGTGTG